MKCMLATLGEAVFIVALACGVGLAWNAYSDEGLDLSRDYFKKTVLNPKELATSGSFQASNPTTSQVPSNPSDPSDPMTQSDVEQPSDPSTTVSDTDPADTEEDKPGVDANGLQTINTADAADYHSMGEFAAFVDARSRDHYEEGHISGAYYLNHYQSQKLIDEVRPALEQADFIVVYCGGGDCEDSILLATSLISEYGFDYGRVYVYLGGMEEWKAGSHPITEGSER